MKKQLNSIGIIEFKRKTRTGVKTKAGKSKFLNNLKSRN